MLRIESLPGVQAEDPVAQIFMGRSGECPQYGVHDEEKDGSSVFRIILK